MNSVQGDSQVQESKYSGFAKAGIGTYFTPQAELQFGQSFPEYFYSLGGKYFLTKGFAPNTDQSSGGFMAFGGTTLTSNVPLLRNAALDGKVGYRSESFHFYGSAIAESSTNAFGFPIAGGIRKSNIELFSLQSRNFFGKF